MVIIKSSECCVSVSRCTTCWSNAALYLRHTAVCVAF